jgi:hypothetical protein
MSWPFELIFTRKESPVLERYKIWVKRGFLYGLKLQKYVLAEWYDILATIAVTPMLPSITTTWAITYG